MLHNVNMVKYNLNYASNELASALNNLSKLATINNSSLNENKVNSVKNNVDNQAYILNKYIIPAVNKM